MRDYKLEFEQALKRTKDISLALPDDIYFINRRFLNDKLYEDKLTHFCKNELPNFLVNQISAQCIKVHFEFKSKLEKALGIPIYYTIGFIKVGEEKYFYSDEQSLKKLLVNGISGETVNIHTWLTLPSMEILDFVFPTTYGKIKNLKDMYGQTIIKHPEELTGNMSYHPMIVGDDFLFKIGAIKKI